MSARSILQEESACMASSSLKEVCDEDHDGSTLGIKAGLLCLHLSSCSWQILISGMEVPFVGYLL
jgi:hypothetical protein